MKVAILTTDSREHYKDYGQREPYFGAAPEALLQGFAQLPELEVHVVSCARAKMNSPEKVAPNIFFHSLHVPKLGWMRTGYQGCIRATRKKLKEIQPDIVHGQGTERDCAISAVFSGFPNVVTIHGNMNAIAALHQSSFGSFYWLAARLENFTLPQTRGIICISDYVKHLVERYQVQTWIVPNAIQKMFFDFPKAKLATTDLPLLINVGVISERKRQQQVLGLLESLRAEGLSFDTLFVGVSDAHDAYGKGFQDQLGKANRQYRGFEHIEKLDDASFCELFDRASAMIHFSNEESFGLTFAEAIARGLYLFASDVGAVRDIAQGVTGVEIFDLNAWEQLKSSIRQWLISEEKRQRRLQTPPSEFVQRYHPVSIARRHVEIYEEVLRGNNSV
jgi:glycosyltransferase involved in cell wall biosynthesis